MNLNRMLTPLIISTVSVYHRSYSQYFERICTYCTLSHSRPDSGSQGNIQGVVEY